MENIVKEMLNDYYNEKILSREELAYNKLLNINCLTNDEMYDILIWIEDNSFYIAYPKLEKMVKISKIIYNTVYDDEDFIKRCGDNYKRINDFYNRKEKRIIKDIMKKYVSEETDLCFYSSVTCIALTIGLIFINFLFMNIISFSVTLIIVAIELIMNSFIVIKSQYK